jgi:hypothetical protein
MFVQKMTRYVKIRGKKKKKKKRAKKIARRTRTMYGTYLKVCGTAPPPATEEEFIFYFYLEILIQDQLDLGPAHRLPAFY